MNNIIASKKMFRLHWGDCADEILIRTALEERVREDLKSKALEFELVRQERDDVRKKYAELKEHFDKKEKQVCNLELYTKELETRLSYVKPTKKDPVAKELKEYGDRRDYYIKNNRGPIKRNKSSLLSDLLS